MRSCAWWISPIMRTWSSIKALTLAPADAGLLDMLETPVEGAGAAIAAGLSRIGDAAGSLIAFLIAASMSLSEAAASTDAEKLVPHRSMIRPASSAIDRV